MGAVLAHDDKMDPVSTRGEPVCEGECTPLSSAAGQTGDEERDRSPRGRVLFLALRRLDNGFRTLSKSTLFQLVIYRKC